ncbi:MAG: ATP-binding protein [Bacteroidales bacterium]|nr:ATP-binding protein [Bacteroidales bacterium]
MIRRVLENKIRQKAGGNKAVILFGPRQAGKSTLMSELFSGREDILWLNGDDSETIEMFENASINRFKTIFSSYKILIIDEAQQIPDIGRKIKIFTDQIPEIGIVATGSSSFDLADKTSESLTGRKWEFKLFPLSFSEMSLHHGLHNELAMLEHRLLYGYYPEVVTNPSEEKEILQLLCDSYLYKDVLMFANIRHSDMIIKLLQMLALQIGSEVSYNELANSLGIDRGTVERYIDLLEKSFVVFRLPAFSRNLRNELKKSRKIYFTDNGIRNMLLRNFSELHLRNDVGALWENFLISERMKKNNYDGYLCNTYFWRTFSQSELDYLEESDGQLHAYEFKWNVNKAAKSKIPSAFSEMYKNADFTVISPGNVEDFLL